MESVRYFSCGYREFCTGRQGMRKVFGVVISDFSLIKRSLSIFSIFANRWPQNRTDKPPRDCSNAVCEKGRGMPGPFRPGYARLLDGCDESELLEGGHAIIEADLFNDLTVCEPEHSRAGEMHLPPGRGRQCSEQKITERRPRVGAAAFPPPDHIVALSDQVGRAPEVKVRKRSTESGHEGFDVVTTAAGRMQRILQEHVGRGEFVDDGEIAGFPPERGEPAADDGFVCCFFGHTRLLRVAAG